MKTDVDLFIPTYNRPDFLKRLLTFYTHYSFKHRIIIADSSSDSNKKLNKNIIQQFSNLNIFYVDKFSPKQVSHQKFGQMLKYAKAKYTVFCADDDFLFPQGIEESVKFLENNLDYSSVHGTYIAFYIYEGIFGLRKFLWRFIYPFESITLSKPIDRLTSHLENYYQLLWAVRRTDQLKIIYKEFLKSKTDPVMFGEFLPDMLTVIYGKMKRIHTLYSARQAFSTAYKYWPSLLDAIQEGTYEKEYKKFRKCLVVNLNKTTRIDPLKAERLIDSSMKKYLSYMRQEHLTGRLNLFLGNLPMTIANAVRQLHVFYLHIKPNHDRIGKIDRPESKYFKDLVYLKELVLKN